MMERYTAFSYGHISTLVTDPSTRMITVKITAAERGPFTDPHYKIYCGILCIRVKYHFVAS